MKRFVAAVAGIVTLGWSAVALAQADNITTSCPISFQCAFSAAETMSLVTPKTQGTPGQPDVFVGYMVFDATGANVTLTGLQNVNGTVGTIGGASGLAGTCASGTSGQPALITFTSGPTIAFVTNAAQTELQFILSRDLNSAKTSTSNSVRVGVCRQ